MKMLPTVPVLACGATLATMAFAAPNPAEYLARYDGEWSGSGMVITEDMPNPTEVSCAVEGDQLGRRSFSLEGSCRAFIIFSREIGADLKYDPATQTYTGTYIGSKSGPARLVGKRNGDSLNLEVTWGRQIYDDDKARMTITNTGGNTFQMIVTEQINGESVRVSDLSFQRS